MPSIAELRPAPLRLFADRPSPRLYDRIVEVLRRVQAVYQQDLAEGYGRVELPHALARKYPKANREWGWQFVFPQERRWRNPNTGVRFPLHSLSYMRNLQ